jgi:hypothetical protein
MILSPILCWDIIVPFIKYNYLIFRYLHTKNHLLSLLLSEEFPIFIEIAQI